MAEGIGISFDTSGVTRALKQMQRDFDNATKAGVSAAARKVVAEARRAAPVYGGKTAKAGMMGPFRMGGPVHISVVKRYRRAGLNLSGQTLGKGETVEGNRVVVGALRDGISASSPKKVGDGTYQVHVSPKGPRVHLYAKKIEKIAGYMAAGHEAAAPAMVDAFNAAAARTIEKAGR